MIYEIRNYHFRPDLIEDYKVWARSSALPYLSSRMDVVGFWVKTGDPVEVLGEPQDKLGPANITWIIRWRDLDQRHAAWAAALATPEWDEVAAKAPGGPASYLRHEFRYMESLV